MAVQTNQGTKNSLSDHMKVMDVAKGILISYLVTIPAFILFAFILTYTSFPEKYISTVVVITTIVSILTAGSISTRNLKTRGWLNGIIIGFIYMLVLYVLSSLVYNNFSINRYVATMAVIGMLTGAIGGIIGINLKKPSQPRSRHRRI